MIVKTLAFLSFAMFGLSASYMYAEDMALSYYGETKSYGKVCSFIDVELNFHTYYVGGEDGLGVHGCPIFTPIR